eukprot:scaffold107541_cov36-Phaeocystis_antarctica.AAC.1
MAMQRTRTKPAVGTTPFTPKTAARTPMIATSHPMQCAVRVAEEGQRYRRRRRRRRRRHHAPTLMTVQRARTLAAVGTTPNTPMTAVTSMIATSQPAQCAVRVAEEGHYH